MIGIAASIFLSDRNKIELFVSQLKETVEGLQQELGDLKESREFTQQHLVKGYEQRVERLQRQRDDIQTCLMRELEIKEDLYYKMKDQMEKHISIAEQLRIKLKIPRHHLQHLEQVGTLDEFVNAKLNSN